jgi:hypothetical protein
MAKMRIAIERRNQAALQKRAAENRRNATAELNAILAEWFRQETVIELNRRPKL